jgi:hypothetical protein
MKKLLNKIVQVQEKKALGFMLSLEGEIAEVYDLSTKQIITINANELESVKTGSVSAQTWEKSNLAKTKVVKDIEFMAAKLYHYEIYGVRAMSKKTYHEQPSKNRYFKTLEEAYSYLEGL